MKKIEVDLPDRTAAEIAEMVQAGWFASEGEALRAAILDFVRRNRRDFVERFQQEDIDWAVTQAK